MRIAPRSRQAFLLTALEGFTPSEAAQILGADFNDVEKLIAEAQAEIDAELATDVLIIEDEPVIAADIEAWSRSWATPSPTSPPPDRGGRRRRPQPSGPGPGRHPAGRRLVGHRRGQGHPEALRRAGDLHHRLPRAPADRRAPGTDLPDHQALPAGNGEGGDRPGAVLPPAPGARGVQVRGVIGMNVGGHEVLLQGVV
jgi:hypothetical protein